MVVGSVIPNFNKCLYVFRMPKLKKTKKENVDLLSDDWMQTWDSRTLLGDAAVQRKCLITNPHSHSTN